MTYLALEIDGTEGEENVRNFVDDAGEESYSVRISNDAAENGYEQEPGPLAWINSARITTDPSDDAVHCVVSIDDPRGGFCFTVRRLPNGRMVIHMPHPSEGMPHIETRELHPGTLELGSWVPIDSHPAGWNTLPDEFRVRSNSSHKLEQWYPMNASDPDLEDDDLES